MFCSSYNYTKQRLKPQNLIALSQTGQAFHIDARRLTEEGASQKKACVSSNEVGPFQTEARPER